MLAGHKVTPLAYPISFLPFLPAFFSPLSLFAGCYNVAICCVGQDCKTYTNVGTSITTYQPTYPVRTLTAAMVVQEACLYSTVGQCETSSSNAVRRSFPPTPGPKDIPLRL